MAKALIDTGRRVSLLVRTGLIQKWTRAERPLSFTTASGSVMPGGGKGRQFHLSVLIQGEYGPYPATLTSHYGYQADIAGVDMIRGYPLLATYGIMVDSKGDCLRLEEATDEAVKICDFSLSPSPVETETPIWAFSPGGGGLLKPLFGRFVRAARTNEF